MPRLRRTRTAAPDSNYQIPHPELVTNPPTLIDRARFDLARFKHLWEQLGLESQRLLADVAELEAAGGCPPDLHTSISHALALILQPADQGFAQGAGGVGGGGDGDGDEGKHNHDHDRNNIPMGESEGVGGEEEEDLARILGGLNVASPLRLIRQYGPRAVSEALDVLRSKSAGEVVNPGAYLRAVLRKYSPAAVPKPTGSRYTRGRYGHMVRT